MLGYRGAGVQQVQQRASQPASLSCTQWCHPTGVLHSFFFFVWLPSRFFAASRCDARGLGLGLLRLGAHDSRHALGHWQREEARPMFQRAETTASYSGVTVWSPSVSRLGCSVLGAPECQNARMPECSTAWEGGPEWEESNHALFSVYP